MSIVNSMLQFYRVLQGAEEMNETLTPEERFIVVISTWVIIPLIAGAVIYFLFLYTTRFVEYMGDVLFPEKQPAAAPKATKAGRSPVAKRKAAKID